MYHKIDILRVEKGLRSLIFILKVSRIIPKLKGTSDCVVELTSIYSKPYDLFYGKIKKKSRHTIRNYFLTLI